VDLVVEEGANDEKYGDFHESGSDEKDAHFRMLLLHLEFLKDLATFHL
jgi:hypothetical protein